MNRLVDQTGSGFYRAVGATFVGPALQGNGAQNASQPRRGGVNHEILAGCPRSRF
jgi:hypothetical protein